MTATVRRRARVAAAASLATLTVAGCGQAVPNQATGSESTPTTTPSTPTSPPTTPWGMTSEPVQDCTKLIAAGWKVPDDGEPDINWDPATGVAIISVGTDDPHIVVNVLDDAQCSRLPGLERIIPNMIAQMEHDRAAECADTVERILSGKPELRDAPVDKQKLNDLVMTWCPPRFAAMLGGN